MALNLKNPEVERLASEVAKLAGETKTEAVRRALSERRDRLAIKSAMGQRGSGFLRYLESEVWPKVPASKLGRRLPKRKLEQILGYEREGV